MPPSYDTINSIITVYNSLPDSNLPLDIIIGLLTTFIGIKIFTAIEERDDSNNEGDLFD